MPAHIHQTSFRSLKRSGLASVAALALSGLGACINAQIAVEEPAVEKTMVAVPAFDEMMANLADQVTARAVSGIPVPIPADAGGGYTHEQHKQNGKTIYEAGMLYRHTGEARYRDLIRTTLFQYADLYPSLDLHPEATSSNKGRLFWQGLNEAWWLVYAIQGYEAVRAELTEEERTKIEDGVFNPMADFLSTGSPQTFDQIHNHATWSAAGVGMTGYVLGQPERVEQALLGLDMSGEFGFLRQLDLLFSPDGYYAEGPYYQRYALMPFVLFSQAIEKNDPERRIFEHRDGIVLKAIHTTMQLSYAGRFFPINDAIREKGINTVELKYGLAIAYERTGDPEFLGAAELQNGVVPTPGGRALLEGIAAGQATPYQFASELLSDGPDGTNGGLIILRSGPENDASAAIMKATTQGLGHGHFDKLGLLYYDDGHEIVADYGAARFLNVEAKNGGRYLPENDSWAKQTVAHNVLVVDETSHFGGDWREGQKHSPSVVSFGDVNGVQIAAAEIDTAYDGVNLQRVIALVPKPDSPHPYLIDIVRGQSDGTHSYDLPVHFKGQLIETSYPLTSRTTVLTPLGQANGYQHLWHRAHSEPLSGTANMSWLLGDQFYTLTYASDAPTTTHFVELGANDPNNNLRREQAAIMRTDAESVSFVSIYERHGRYDSDEEVTVFQGSSVSNIEIDRIDSAAVYSLSLDGADIHILFADDTDPSAVHQTNFDGNTITWTGAIHVLR